MNLEPVMEGLLFEVVRETKIRFSYQGVRLLCIHSDLIDLVKIFEDLFLPYPF